MISICTASQWFDATATLPDPPEATGDWLG